MECPVGGTPLPLGDLDHQTFMEVAAGRDADWDDNVTASEHATLYCVASGCRYCGKELFNCVKPKGSFNWVDLRLQAGLELVFFEPCVPVVSLTFASYEKMMHCWDMLEKCLATPMRVWWSKACRAGSPRTVDETVFVDDRSREDYYHYLRGEWGYDDCTMVIMPRELHNPIQGRWVDHTLVLELRRLLGCLPPQLFQRVVSALDSKSVAQCELVPVFALQRWLDERERVLDGCQWQDFKLKSSGADDLDGFHPLDVTSVVS